MVVGGFAGRFFGANDSSSGDFIKSRTAASVTVIRFVDTHASDLLSLVIHSTAIVFHTLQCLVCTLDSSTSIGSRGSLICISLAGYHHPLARQQHLNAMELISAQTSEHGHNFPKFTQASQPRKSSAPFNDLYNAAAKAYYRYETTFGLYVMTYEEKVVVNIVVVCLLSLLFLATFVYFPKLLVRFSHRLAYYVHGHTPVFTATRQLLATTTASTRVLWKNIIPSEVVTETARIEL